MSPILTRNNMFNCSVSSAFYERYTSPKPISNEFVLSDVPRPRTRTVSLAAPNQVGLWGRVEVAWCNSQHIPTIQIVDLPRASWLVGEVLHLIRICTADEM